jgi:hypothetical protein
MDFNKKYHKYIVDSYPGLSIDEPTVAVYLDKKFKEFIKRDDVKIYNIGLRIGSAMVEVDGIENFEIEDLEFNIDKLLKGKLTPKYP